VGCGSALPLLRGQPGLVEVVAGGSQPTAAQTYRVPAFGAAPLYLGELGAQHNEPTAFHPPLVLGGVATAAPAAPALAASACRRLGRQRGALLQVSHCRL
jgi:hypothetical protein